MNANELADLLERWRTQDDLGTMNEAATMLRQQQDTIQKLSERIKWLEGAKDLKKELKND